MPNVTLRGLRIDESTWAAGSAPRKSEWRVAIAEVVQEGRFDADSDGPHEVLLTLAGDKAFLQWSDSRLELPIRELQPLMEEYMQIIREMSKLSVATSSPRLEALDIAKRITHDEAGEAIASAMRGLKPDHRTARRLFTLLVTLFHDTTKMAAPAHFVR